MTTILTRRDFLRTGVTQGALLTGGWHASEGRTRRLTDTGSAFGTPPANDQIQLALIGAGNQGQGDMHIALQVPGVKLVGAADCYDGRLVHCREQWGKDVFTT